MNLIIFDTSILVNDLRTAQYEERLQSAPGLVRLSAVVLAELWRGATRRSERDFLIRLARNRSVLTPTEKNWLESGEILARMSAALGYAPTKLRDLHFDLLIALTARTHGARLITANRSDFETIRRYRNFELEVW